MSTLTLNATIPTDGSPVSIPELVYSIAYFRGQYFAAIKELKLLDIDLHNPPTYDECYAIAQNLSESMYMSGALDEQIATAGLEEALPGEVASDLLIIDIQRKNPIEVALLGLSTPLLIAVILSGGELKLGPLQVKLPALGKGIKELRAALQPLPPTEIKRLREKSTVAPEEARLPRLKR